MQTPRPCKRLAAEPSSDRQTGKEGRTSMREQEFPQCGKTLYAHAHPHTKPFSPQESASLSHPRKARPLSPLGNHGSDGHTRPRACSPRFELDTHPQPKRPALTPLAKHSHRSQAHPPNHTHHPQPYNEPTTTPNRTSGTKRGKAYLSSRTRDKERGTHASAKGVTRGGGHLPPTHGDTRASLQPRQHKARGERAFPTRGA